MIQSIESTGVQPFGDAVLSSASALRLPERLKRAERLRTLLRLAEHEIKCAGDARRRIEHACVRSLDLQIEFAMHACVNLIRERFLVHEMIARASFGDLGLFGGAIDGDAFRRLFRKQLLSCGQ